MIKMLRDLPGKRLFPRRFDVANLFSSCVRIMSFTMFFFPVYTFNLMKNGEIYNLKDSQRLMDLAAAAYCCGNLGHGVADWSCEACKRQPQVTNVTVISSKDWKDGNGYVAYDSIHRAIVVVFAGTDHLSIVDWIDDLRFDKVPYPSCSNTSKCAVHNGFYQTYKAMTSDIVSSVIQLQALYGADTHL